jgi:hypothetical protein
VVHSEKEKLEFGWPLSDIMLVVYSTGAISQIPELLLKLHFQVYDASDEPEFTLTGVRL